jgi:hypothetical protein
VIREMKGKHILIGGILAGAIIEIVSLAVSWAIQTIAQYNVMDLPGMRPVNDPIAILFFVYPWVLGFALAVVFASVHKSFEGPTGSQGMKFGFLMWIVIGIPSAFLVFTSMDYPFAFTINALLGSLIYLLLTGILLTTLFGKMK